jgi:hypothetical protein
MSNILFALHARERQVREHVLASLRSGVNFFSQAAHVTGSRHLLK